MKDNVSFDDVVIGDDVSAERFLEKCAGGASVAIDTEFDCVGRRFPRLDIIQLNCGGDGRILDAPRIDGRLMAGLLENGGIIKVLHSPSEDLRILHRYAGVAACSVFDTQLAARFVSYRNSVSLQKLVMGELGVYLMKSETLSNWRKRPLTPSQVDYALDDVRYLIDVMASLLGKAEERGVADWMLEEMSEWDDPATYCDHDPMEVWKHLTGAVSEPDGRIRAALRQVAAARDELSLEYDVPPSWILTDNELLANVRAGKLRTSRVGWHTDATVNRDRLIRVLTAALDKGLSECEDEWPEVETPISYLESVKTAADEAYEYICGKSDELGVDVSLVCSRQELLRWIDNPEDDSNRLAYGWRNAFVGEEVATRFAVP